MKFNITALLYLTITISYLTRNNCEPYKFNAIFLEPHGEAKGEIKIYDITEGDLLLKIESDVQIISHLLTYYSITPEEIAIAQAKHMSQTVKVPEEPVQQAAPTLQNAKDATASGEPVQQADPTLPNAKDATASEEPIQQAAPTLPNAKDATASANKEQKPVPSKKKEIFSIPYKNIKNVEYFTDKYDTNIKLNNKNIIFNPNEADGEEVFGIQLFFVSLKKPLVFVKKPPVLTQIINEYKSIERQIVNAYPYQKMFDIVCELKERFIKKVGKMTSTKSKIKNIKNIKLPVSDKIIEQLNEFETKSELDNSFYLIRLLIMKKRYNEAIDLIEGEIRYIKAKELNIIEGKCKQDAGYLEALKTEEWIKKEIENGEKLAKEKEEADRLKKERKAELDKQAEDNLIVPLEEESKPETRGQQQEHESQIQTEMRPMKLNERDSGLNLSRIFGDLAQGLISKIQLKRKKSSSEGKSQLVQGEENTQSDGVKSPRVVESKTRRHYASTSSLTGKSRSDISNQPLSSKREKTYQ
jgi:hypothetical protein